MPKKTENGRKQVESLRGEATGQVAASVQTKDEQSRSGKIRRAGQLFIRRAGVSCITMMKTATAQPANCTTETQLPVKIYHSTRAVSEFRLQAPRQFSARGPLAKVQT